jgi:hypothetical protein
VATVSDKLVGAYCVFKEDGTLGIWQTDYSSFAKLENVTTATKLNSIAFSKDAFWGVTEPNPKTPGNVVNWKNAGPSPSGDAWNAGSWSPLNALGDVTMLAFGPAAAAGQSPMMFAVGTDGQIRQWQGFQWSPALYQPTGDPKVVPPTVLSMIAWDTAATPNLWAVSGTDVMKWDPNYNQWEDYKTLGAKQLQMLAFDASGGMWGLDADGHIWRWDSGTSGASGGAAGAVGSAASAVGSWKQDPYFANVKVSWLAFKPAAAPAGK